MIPVPSVEPALTPFASTLEDGARTVYEEMTPRQQQGVEKLAERLGPERTTEWLLASPEERVRIFPLHWDPNRIAFGATLEEETLALYERLDERGRADLEFYADALGHEAAMSALLALREREREWMEWNESVSPPAGSDDSNSPLPSGSTVRRVRG